MFGVPRPRESGDLWGKNSFFPFFYAWFLFSREQNGSYFRAHIKNAKIWTREVLKRENEVRAKKMDVYSSLVKKANTPVKKATQ